MERSTGGTVGRAGGRWHLARSVDLNIMLRPCAGGQPNSRIHHLLRAHPPAHLPTRTPAFLPARPPARPLAFLSACPPACLPAAGRAATRGRRRGQRRPAGHDPRHCADRWGETGEGIGKTIKRAVGGWAQPAKITCWERAAAWLGGLVLQHAWVPPHGFAAFIICGCSQYLVMRCKESGHSPSGRLPALARSNQLCT